jgi:hypothetical protein
MASKFRFDADDIVRRVTQKALDAGEDRARERIRTIRCPDHHQPPTVASSHATSSGKTRDLRIIACCQKVVDMARAALKQ